MTEVVLDASALLALIQQEPGGEKVRPMLPQAAMSAVNYGESVQRLRRGGTPLESVTRLLAAMVPEPVAFDKETAIVAATIHEKTRSQGLSFGDCACLALALMRGIPAVTAERKWDRCDIDVEIIRIR